MLKVLSTQEIIKPKAVIFDTDNTLYLYKPAHKSAINAFVSKAVKSLKVDKKTLIETYNYSRIEIKKQLGNTASSHSRLLYFQRTIENLGFGTRIFLTLDLEQTYWREFLANTRLFPGVQEFLLQLKNNGVKTANITDLTAQIQFRKMVYFKLDEYFDYVVTSEETGYDKPSIEPFNMALKKLNLSPQEVWMVGDDSINDIQGAKQAGIITFQKVEKTIKTLDSDVVFDNFSDLCQYYVNLN
jgi:putative hydrolase of the HAD superfamily